MPKAASARYVALRPMKLSAQSIGAMTTHWLWTTATGLARFAGFSATTATSCSNTRSTATLCSERSITSTRIEAIRPDGVEEVFDIQVEETENFIANGAVSHNTRWVMDDLTGRVLDEEGGIDEGGLWEVVCYPAEATRDEYRMPDGRLVHQPQEGATLLRRQGELLHPERFSHEDLEQHRADPVTWAALYQQDPTAGEAGQFSRELIDACACTSGDIPKRLTRYTAWDTASGIKEINDYCAGLTVGVDENEDVWFLDLVHERFAPDELVEAIIDNYFQFRQQLVGIEKTQYVVGLEASFDRRLYERGGTSLPLELLPHGNKDKVARSKPIQVWMRQGRVHIPTDAPWYKELRKELIDFPGGRHDDIVDVVSYIGQMLDEMTTPFVQAGARNQEVPGWRNALREMQTRQGQGRRRSWKTA